MIFNKQNGEETFLAVFIFFYASPPFLIYSATRSLAK